VHVFIFKDIFPETHIWNKSQELESCRIYPLTRSHTENLQIAVVGLMEYCQCPPQRYGHRHKLSSISAIEWYKNLVMQSR
jgi:hypothetical protein